MSERYRGVLAGAVSGILAGIIMGIVSMLVSYRTGMGLLLPLHMVAATFYGVGALVDGAGVAAIGLIIHLVVSAFFGVVFALLTQTNIAQRGPLIRGGLVFAIVIWAIMTFLFLPAVNPTMSSRVALQPTGWFIEHIVFGVVLSFLPNIERILFKSQRREQLLYKRAA